MPGIFGLIDKNVGDHRSGNAWFSAALNSMAQVMRYENWYFSSTHSFSELGIYVGCVGNSTNRLSENFRKEKGLSLFLSNWGSYDAENLRTDQEEYDTHILGVLGHYENVGYRFPEFISGLNAGILVDERRKSCILFNDRYGIERLFLYEDNEKIVFSSEAKAILAIVPETRDFDPIGLGEFLASGCTLGENSLYQHISVIPPSTAISFTKGRPLRKSRYLDYSELEGLDVLQKEDYFLEKFSDKLKELVRIYSQKNERTGISLTGGLDSRMIMASLPNNPKTTCYTFGSMYRKTYDVRIAREVAKKCGLNHQVISLGDDFLDKFHTYLNRSIFISDGYFGFAGAAELYVNSFARKIAPLRITGNYGSELLRGARAFKSLAPKGDFLRPELVDKVNRAIEVFSGMSTMHPTSFTLFFHAPSIYGRYVIERSQVSLFTPFLERELVELIYRRPLTFRSGIDPSIEILKIGAEALVSIPTDRGILGNKVLAYQLAMRIFREAVFKLEYWTDQGLPASLGWSSRIDKWELSERLFLGRHKFQHFGNWSRNQLLGVIETILETGKNSSLERYIDFDKVATMFVEHRSGNRNFISEIDKLVTLILADRQFLGGNVNVKSVR